jgi:tRNA (guanine26-N2/guanine27-N2)-dimethyltransferase
MKLNRDVTVAVLNSIKNEEMTMYEMMSASGLRSIRLLKELKETKIKTIFINDYSDDFLFKIKENFLLNDIKEEECNFNKSIELSNLRKNGSQGKRDYKKIEVHNQDANILCQHITGFDYIDIDPYGSPNPFLDSAMKRLSRNSILGITATDTAPLCGTFEKVCTRRYHSKPLRNELMHEVGLRILIKHVQQIANIYDKELTPIFSYYQDHYFRVFFRCRKSKEGCNEIEKQHQYLLTCNNCKNLKFSKHNKDICELCENNYFYSGKMWSGKLFDNELVKEIYKNYNNKFDKKFQKFTALIKEESEYESKSKNKAFFYDIHSIAKKYKLQDMPKLKEIIEKLNLEKIQNSKTHFLETALKCDTEIEELLKLLKN